jgi:hypothetical protein
MKKLLSKEERQGNVNAFNEIDLDLKQWRDSNTTAHSFVEDMNHTLKDLGERGFSYSKMNSLLGNQIAQHARSVSDRRHLQFLDEIKTPGGVWGNTQEGLKLKELTKNQINADETRRVQRARAERLEATDVKVHKIKAKIGTLQQQKRGLTDKAEIRKVEEEIKSLIMTAQGLGIGDRVQQYYTSMVEGLDKGFAGGQARVLSLYDRINPDAKNPETVKERLLDILGDPNTDVSADQRKIMLNNAFNSENITLDKDGATVVEAMVAQFVAAKDTTHFKEALARLDQETTNSKLRYKQVLTRAEKQVARNQGGQGFQTKAIPIGLTRIIDATKSRFREVYNKTFSTFSDTLENDENPRYGYTKWSPIDKKNFNEQYLNNVAGIIDEFKLEAEEFHNETGEQIEQKEKSHKQELNDNPVSKDAPTDYSQLEDMLYDRSDGVAIDNNIRVTKGTLLVKLKEAILGLTPGATKSQKEAASSNIYFADIGSWYETSVGGSSDPVIKSQVLQDIWRWSMYLIERDELNKIDRSNRSDKEKEDSSLRFKKIIKNVKFPALNL